MRLVTTMYMYRVSPPCLPILPAPLSPPPHHFLPLAPSSRSPQPYRRMNRCAVGDYEVHVPRLPQRYCGTKVRNKVAAAGRPGALLVQAVLGLYFGRQVRCTCVQGGEGRGLQV